MLEKIKNSLRIDGNDHDDELMDLLSAAKRELIEAGAREDNLKDDDALFIRACITYCKANFGYDDEKSKFEAAFEKMLIKMSMLGTYIGDADEE